jgi:murein L,D-transpeptidase YcbB/YkuD
VAAPVAVGQWGTGYTFWQYTGSGAANGITGNVDQDRYNGSLDQLHAYLTRVETDAGAPPFDLTTMSGVQAALNYLGQAPPLAEDGIEGPKTRMAIESFQSAHRLQVDGVVGAQTRAALQAAVEAQAGG